MPQTEVAGRQITYNEVRGNGLTRGISLFRTGVANSKIQYWFDPNPHDNRSYNKNQALFYLTAAQQIGEGINDDAWPAYGTVIRVMGEDYSMQA